MRIQDVLSYDSLRRLHKINVHLQAVASEIEELGPNAGDFGYVSEKLAEVTGVNLRNLRDVCDELAKIERKERERAKKFQDFLDEKISRNELELDPDFLEIERKMFHIEIMMNDQNQEKEYQGWLPFTDQPVYGEAEAKRMCENLEKRYRCSARIVEVKKC